MKKMVALLLAALFMFACCAFAAGEFVGDMQVINCREWVSLRKEPSTEAERLTKIPLGGIVEECYRYNEEWVYGLYFGMYGYVSTDYLAPTGNYNDIKDSIYAEHNGVHVFGNYVFDSDGEMYVLSAYNEDGANIWNREVRCSYTTELQLVDAFFGGTEDKPLVIAFSADTGLTALDFYTGAAIWNIPDSTLSLGGSISHAVDSNGTIYIGGFYGPDPLAISADGEVLWQTDFKGVYYWLHTIEAYDDHLICYFDMDDTTYEPVTVMLAKNGDFMGLVYR